MVKKIGMALIITLLSLILLFISGCAGSPTTAGNGNMVKVNYTGTLEDGQVFDSSEGQAPLEFTLGEGTMISGFEQAVYGMRIGESKTVTIPAEDAYGPHNDDLVLAFMRDQWQDESDPEVGGFVQFQTTDDRIFTGLIIEVTEETITIDANHPLAGRDLTFEIELVEIN